MIHKASSEQEVAAQNQGPQNAGQGRGAPKFIQLLLPVWGPKFITQFLTVSLPTLLAPGNLPALAKALPSKFIFLTNTEGANILRDHPGTHYLRTICEVEISLVDDLITDDNYSTTITLAYARAVRAAGPRMLDTCFFFLISDYIVADGSLSNVLARMQAGFSGVVAGNFQVVEETASESFFQTFDSGESAIVLPPRQLTKWAFEYLHPMTLANTVNFPLCHSIHSNRLFWRVDADTLIGRFYLIHMICIRPELTNFVIGASCDYSFVPEMCPSGRVHHMTDSDEYLVVEMQKRSHERSLVRLGPGNYDALAESLSEWTTAVHRSNALFPIVYHVTDDSPHLQSAIIESEKFIADVDRRLAQPQPHRDHTYWLGAMAAHHARVLRRNQQINPLLAYDELTPERSTLEGLLLRGRDHFFGRPPNVRPWHPRWPDYTMIRKLGARCFPEKQESLLIISTLPAIFRDWMSGAARSSIAINLSVLLSARLDGQKFDGCLLVLFDHEIFMANAALVALKRLLPKNGRILIFVLNGQGASVNMQFMSGLLNDIGQFYDNDLSLDQPQFVPTGNIPWLALASLRSALGFIRKGVVWLPWAMVVAGFGCAISFFSNLTRRTMSRPGRRLCSSFGIVARRLAEPALGPAPGMYEAALVSAGRRFQKSPASRSHVVQTG